MIFRKSDSLMKKELEIEINLLLLKYIKQQIVMRFLVEFANLCGRRDLFVVQQSDYALRSKDPGPKDNTPDSLK